MRILQVSTLDEGGGAETIARQLHSRYRAAGHEAWLAVGCKRTEAAGVVEIPNDARRPAWERFFLRRAAPFRHRLPRYAIGALSNPARAVRRLRGDEDFDYPATRELLTFVPRPDVVHAHNLHGGYFDLRELPVLSNTVPTLLTLHDAWLTTGHCAHSFDCGRWETGCGNCPYLDTYPPLLRDNTAANWQRKRSIYQRSRLHVVTPSQWLMSRVARSILAPAIVSSRVIPNGVDLDVFTPAPRDEAREPAIVIASAPNAFRDTATLQEAVARIGSASRVIHLPAAGATADAYRAADVYLHAARADTFPTTVLEALACGTPVVATRAGGIPEQIIDGVTGFLTPPGDAAAMAEAAMQIIRNRRAMSAAARADAERRFDVRRMASDYLDLLAALSS